MPDTKEPRYSPVFNTEDADFRLISSDNVIFSVHTLILQLASSVFKTMLSVPQPAQKLTKELPFVELTETGTTLELLLQFIYPMKSPSYLSFNHFAEVLEAASKYAIEGTVDALRLLLLSPRVDAERKSIQIRPSLAEQDPLRAYAIATSMGWKAEAIQASTLTLRTNLTSSASSSELDNMPTKYYRWLNEIHEERRVFFRRLLEEFDDEPSEYRVKKCKDCGMDPLAIWWDDYLQRATTSASARPLGDRVFDLNILFPPDDEVDEFGCQSCPSLAVPLETLYALSRLKLKLSKRKESIKHKYINQATSATSGAA